MALQQYYAGHPVQLPDAVRLYFLCKSFHTLPFSGNLIDQPNTVLDQFILIDSIVKENESEGKKLKEM